MRHLLLAVGSAAAVLPFTIHGQCVTTFPSTEAFTGFTVGTPGTFVNNWTNLTTDDLDWFADNNGTPSAATGPIGDHTSNNTSGKYLYVEATGSTASPNKTAIVQSPCYNISGLASPYLTFWYHMRGSQMGALYVDLNVNGTIHSGLWTASGDQGRYWKQGWLNLAPWVGQTNVRVRFRAVTGTGELSDIAVDDVVVGNLVPLFGCNESTAANYNAGVNINNGTCDYSCPSGQQRVRVDLVADNYPSEISWTLKNGATNVVLASGSFTGTTVCVPAGACLVFRINDTAGDGIYHPSYGYGGYAIFLDGTLIREGGQYAQFEETVFNCPPGFSCTQAIPIGLGQHTAPSVEYWYDFTPAQPGAYTISTCGLNTCDTKLWLYDMACNLVNPQPGIEGATFGDDNDGGCGLQAVVNANMPAGVTHHLRVGTNGGSCSSVTFEIIYNGPVEGCMDPGSCNYEPLATIPCVGCCIAPGSPNCPDGPDLIMSQSALESSLNLVSVNITDACAPVEGCTKGFGQRYVLRFTTRIENIGTTDYYIGSPSAQPQMFDFNNCHGHAHYAGYADYILFDTLGNKIPVGFKNGFCVIDVGCYPGNTGQYGCSNMGISKGCYDIYGSGTTCNWIDITDVPAGKYTLVLRTNWQQAPDALGRHEQDYSNNYAQVCIQITRNGLNVPSFSVVGNCPTYTDCLGQPYGDAVIDCTGQCAGTTRTGDLNSDGFQTQPDAQAYVLGIHGNDVSTTACTDLNNDGEVTVTDAALMVNCYSTQDAHDQTPHQIHYHPWCDFPRGWLSSLDTVRLAIGAFDQVNGTVDIHIRNPDCRVLGYEFELSGLTIQSVQNLVPSLQGDISVSSSLGGTKVIGLSYLDSTLAKNTSYVPLVRITYLSLTGAQICIANVTDVVNDQANNVITRVENGCVAVNNVLTLAPKAFLEGSYDTGTGLMRDELRTSALIPATEPYTALGYVQAGGGGGEQLVGGVLDVTGPNAIVDWVLVELRSAVTPSTIVATRCALLQRDGDIVAVDGVSNVVLNASPGSYHVAVRHRNHLGAMTSAALALSGTPVTVDLRSPGTATWGTQARKTSGAVQLLWAGNVVRDGSLKYAGANNDRDPILNVVGGNTPTAVAFGYYREDVNMSGVVKYAGSANDRDPILVNIGGTVPTAVRLEQLP
ncbi:MAG: hypothetical protein IPG35_15815 [Flavobacteriales bacterium]|nr:hypothetical protein [Flavobacteriales bacterium]MBK9700803.1 hypothetical protein [Flavobacteriales bacterium]